MQPLLPSRRQGMEEIKMVNCENCGKENAARYCGECVRVMQYEAQVHADSADADRFEVEVAFEPELDAQEMDPSYMGGLDSDLLGEE